MPRNTSRGKVVALFLRQHAWPRRYKIGASVLFLAALGFTIYLAIWASSDEAPDGAQSALLVVIAAILQGASVWAFSKDRPSLAMTKTAVRHVAKIGLAVTEAKELAELAVDSRTEKASTLAVRELSVRLSAIEALVSTNIEDWVLAHPEILPKSDLENTQ